MLKPTGESKVTESTIHYICFPRTKLLPHFASIVASVFQKYEQQIGTVHLEKELTSDELDFCSGP
jgi:hypothetical protein